jgi:hypothetical protein
MDEKSFLNKYFVKTEDDALIFKGTKMIIQISEDSVEKNVTVINQTAVSTLGIFEAYIFDDIEENDISKAIHKFTLKLPTVIYLNPSHIDLTTKTVEDVATGTLSKENYYNFIFLYDDVFIESTNVVQSFNTVDHFIYMLLQGQLPKTVRYDEIASLWAECAAINGSGTLKSDYNMLAMIISNLVRDPNNLSSPFRLSYDKYYEKGIYNGKMIKYMDIPRYISNFTAITGSDPRYGVTVAMTRMYADNEKDVKSPVEEIIK